MNESIIKYIALFTAINPTTGERVQRACTYIAASHERAMRYANHDVPESDNLFDVEVYDRSAIPAERLLDIIMDVEVIHNRDDVSNTLKKLNDEILTEHALFLIDQAAGICPLKMFDKLKQKLDENIEFYSILA